MEMLRRLRDVEKMSCEVGMLTRGDSDVVVVVGPTVFVVSVVV